MAIMGQLGFSKSARWVTQMLTVANKEKEKLPLYSIWHGR